MNLIEPSVDLEKLQKISDKDRQLLAKTVAMRPSDDCENSVANLRMWSNPYQTQIATWNGRVLVYNACDKLLHYPLGEDVSPEDLAGIACAFRSAGMLKSNYIYNVPPYYLEKYPEASKYFRLVADPADADYIYDAQKLFNLTGAKLRKKRNHIKHFLTRYPDFTVENIDASNLDEAVAFMDVIDIERGLYIEDLAIDYAHRHFDDLNLRGLILRHESGKIASVSMFSKISDTTYGVHFEKTDKTVEGAAQFMVQLEAKAIIECGGLKMNREQDLGDPNLRHAKESLDPESMYRRMRAYFLQ